MQNFESLRVWQDARKLVADIYSNSTGFPKEENFGLLLQIKRAAISIASNLAEGSARHGQKDKAHFYAIAYSSLMELKCQLIIAEDLGFNSSELSKHYTTELEKIARQISRLRSSV